MFKPFIVHCSSCKIFFMTFQMETVAANVHRIRPIIEQHHSSPSVLLCPYTSPI